MALIFSVRIPLCQLAFLVSHNLKCLNIYKAQSHLSHWLSYPKTAHRSFEGPVSHAVLRGSSLDNAFRGDFHFLLSLVSNFPIDALLFKYTLRIFPCLWKLQFLGAEFLYTSRPLQGM